MLYRYSSKNVWSGLWVRIFRQLDGVLNLCGFVIYTMRRFLLLIRITFFQSFLALWSPRFVKRELVNVFVVHLFVYFVCVYFLSYFLSVHLFSCMPYLVTNVNIPWKSNVDRSVERKVTLKKWSLHSYRILSSIHPAKVLIGHLEHSKFWLM